MTDGKLIIYGASAGSGKTYTVSKEYIKLLLKEYDGHRRILAVTFTNKATEEMKLRIVRDLYRLNCREDERYLNELAAETGLAPDGIPDIAARALAHLLHDYSHFSVYTIDSFFQRVIRAFACEMGLPASYSVELDQTAVLDESIDLMMDHLNDGDYLKDWLIEWTERKIEEGKSWDFRLDMHRMGNEIFAEDLKLIDSRILNRITDKERIAPFRRKLEKMLDDYRQQLRTFGRKATEIMYRYALSPDDFKGKTKGVGAYFQHLAEGRNVKPSKTILNAVDHIDNWYAGKSSRATDIRLAFDDGLNGILSQTTDFQTTMSVNITTASLILKQLNMLGVLSDLKNHVQEYTRNQNLFLISEASGFLKAIIDDADAPFIYERVGNFYRHFMIDEFQDTSAVQWDNFRPLIINSLSSGNTDWVVGDVKQSIYRWRNTDWKILSRKVESEITAAMGAGSAVKRSLNVNWRSTPEVIRFNNAFFRDAVLHICQAFMQETELPETDYSLAEDIMQAYSDCYQYVPEGKTGAFEGYVKISMIENEQDGQDWRCKALEQLPREIERLQDKGYRPADITILVRTNAEAQDIAATLLEYRREHPDSGYQYDVMSNESLLVCHASSVRRLTAAMHFIIDPDDAVNRSLLRYECQNHTDNTHIPDITASSPDRLQQWQQLPVYELAEKLIQDCQLYRDATQMPFLQAFKDILLHYTRRESTDLRSFLDWWEEHRHGQYIAMPAGQDAIRLITIHKAKGLEFEAVLIPFCNWELNKAGKILWCTPTGDFSSPDPEQHIDLLPLKFETMLGNTVFRKEYLQEKMMSYIDNLNLLYVAFTRAKRTLTVFTEMRQNKFATTGDLLCNVFLQPVVRDATDKGYIRLEDYWQADRLSFEMGRLTELPAPAGLSGTSSVLELIPPEHTWDYVPHITRNSRYFAPHSSTPMDKGKLLHEVFRKIVTTDDLNRTLNLMICEGKLPESEKTRLMEMVRRTIENLPGVNKWFSSNVSVKTEAEILLPDGKTLRPDRIIFDNGKVQVVDYKFGEKELAEHRAQVRNYMRQLTRMGYSRVEGYLWYVNLGKILGVEENAVYGTLF
ncbi:MAG: UvrD-helicase domain-containing protein [Bacteroidales bacterium]|nr:UvrD-helicase domain-containing protein [Bacteroidales bacterium]